MLWKIQKFDWLMPKTVSNKVTFMFACVCTLQWDSYIHSSGTPDCGVVEQEKINAIIKDRNILLLDPAYVMHVVTRPASAVCKSCTHVHYSRQIFVHYSKSVSQGAFIITENPVNISLKLYCGYKYTKHCMINCIWSLKQRYLQLNGHAWFHLQGLCRPVRKANKRFYVSWRVSSLTFIFS